MTVSPFFSLARAIADPSATVTDLEAAAQSIARSRGDHPAGTGRLARTFLDTSAEDATKAEADRLRESLGEDHLAPVIELFGGGRR